MVLVYSGGKTCVAGVFVACRRFPRLHIRVDYETPSPLWCPSKAHMVLDDCSARGPIVSRVPAARVSGLTWTRSVDVLL